MWLRQRLKELLKRLGRADYVLDARVEPWEDERDPDE